MNRNIIADFVSTWGKVNFSDTIAPCDREALEPFMNMIERRTLAEPLHGNPDADVYFLTANPGNSEEDLNFVGNRLMEHEFYKLYNLLDRKRMLWLDQAESIVDQDNNPHPAYKYFKKHLREVLVKKPDADFCWIEFFPYHSKHTFSFPKRLPSYACVDAMIHDAIDHGKLIVIVRQEAAWKERIPELATYAGCVTVNSPQSGYISENNLSESGKAWEELLNRI